MNPLDMMKFSGLWSTFTANHPKFPKFIAAASRKGVLAEGSIIAMQITTPDGETRNQPESDRFRSGTDPADQKDAVSKT